MPKMSRKKFLKNVAMSSVILTGRHLFPINAGSISSIDYKAQTLFLGPVPSRVNVPEWFSYLHEIGTDAYLFYAPHYRGKQFKRMFSKHPNEEKGENDFKSLALISDMEPSFEAYINKKTVAYEEQLIERAYKAALANEIDFYYSFPFPSFPVQDKETVIKLKPEYFKKDGRFDIYSPLLPDLLKKTIRKFKAKLPALKGVNMWLAEGSGEIYDFDHEDLIHVKKWLKPIIKAFSEVSKELNLEAIAFTHNYKHTAETLQQVYEVLSAFPDIIMMQDITWPEENMLMPFEEYLTREDVTLVKNNKSVYMALTDTEYLGQGTWPGVYTRWWKYNIKEIYQTHGYGAIGRVFFWDKGQTDINFNRLNVHLFAAFLNNPSADERIILSASVHEMFGKDCPERLVDILFETEEIIKEVISVNYVSPLSHSGYPSPNYLDADYFKGVYNMKAVNDLFEPAGTPLYTAFTDYKNLNAGNYWRYERKIVSKAASEYLRTKQQSIDWLKKIIPEVKQLTIHLKPEHRNLFITSYNSLFILAKGMKVFVEAAKVHYDWYRAKRINKQEALFKMQGLAKDLRLIADQIGDYDPLNQRKRMSLFADAIESLKIEKKDS